MDEFNKAVSSCGLSEVSFDGPPFTWTNGKVWQCLDRALTNEAWTDTFEVTKVSHLVHGRSDHAPLLIRCDANGGKSSAFRFLNVRTKSPSFKDVVKEAWLIRLAGGMVGFHQRLLNVKRSLRFWNNRSFGHIFRAVTQAEEELRDRQVEFDATQDDVSRACLGEAKARHARALAIECDYWTQKSSIKWLQQRDANTKFFHSVVKQRWSMNFISRIKEEGGQWIEEEVTIQECAARFFE
ncbi:uncharacterized protein [Coffea arabica]|uniref:Uncharacterized protein n=1 Tax=Coffea arabica TaxID=13443 RepID=A0A6P6TZB2_COFAR